MQVPKVFGHVALILEVHSLAPSTGACSEGLSALVAGSSEETEFKMPLAVETIALSSVCCVSGFTTAAEIG